MYVNLNTLATWKKNEHLLIYMIAEDKMQMNHWTNVFSEITHPHRTYTQINWQSSGKGLNYNNKWLLKSHQKYQITAKDKFMLTYNRISVYAGSVSTEWTIRLVKLCILKITIPSTHFFVFIYNSIKSCLMK